ncbi:hypothetical protein HK405_003742 [Cladochytrium tenue]|nr:hypothetical protein HK405_003742 [Cladochytrium tenue]
MAQHQQQTAVPSLPEVEEDDEFEEFGDEDDWDPTEEDTFDAEMWVDDWDTDEIQDDFTRHLRAELSKFSKQPDQAQAPQNNSDNKMQ